MTRRKPSLIAPSGRFSIAGKKWLYKAFEGKCQYCGEIIESAKAAHLDHIVPTSKGGEHEEANLRLSCGWCNSAKSNNTLDHLRWYIRIRRSVVSQVITPKQAMQLQSLGIDLMLPEPVVFEFEKTEGQAE